MKTFKRYKLFLVTSVTLFLAASCDEFLQVTPKDSLSTTENVIDGRATAEAALRGLYSALGSDGYYGTSFQSIGYLSGDNVQWTGSQSQVQEFINHKVNADNATINNAWNAIYRTINRANNLIAAVPQVNDVALTDALRNQYLGEAYFIRGLAYFDLARTWGGVPIITTPTVEAGDNADVAKSSVNEVYAQALSDLDAAETLLPETVDRYRATRKTVWALKSRYYLYQNDFAKAEEFATKVISDSRFKLLKPFNTFFTLNARGTEESVFEIFYNGTTETNGHRNQWQPQTNGGTRQWAPNDALVKLLSDPAKGGTRSALIARDNQNRWYGNLYYRSPASDPSYVIRIAELYLIRAEARAQQEKLTEGLADLNAVRDRAGLTALTASTKDELLLAIENERRLEFALEPHRWFDLVRTGRADEVLNVTEQFRYVFPIPAEQILVDKAIEQNDGY
jgi:starch-binding outer membrane protein, SusD/RagB family